MLKIILLRSSTVVEQANGMYVCVCVCVGIISQLIYAWSRSIFFILSIFLLPLPLPHYFFLHFFSRSDSMCFFIHCFSCVCLPLFCNSSFIFTSFLNNVRIYLAMHPAERSESRASEVIRRLDNGAKMWRQEMKISFVSNAFLWSLVQHSKHELCLRHNFTWISLLLVGILHWKWKTRTPKKITNETKREPLNQILREKWCWNILCNENLDVIYLNNKMICAPLLKIICVWLRINVCLEWPCDAHKISAKCWNGGTKRKKILLTTFVQKPPTFCAFQLSVCIKSELYLGFYIFQDDFAS